MFRLFKRQAEFLLLCLLYIRTLDLDWGVMQQGWANDNLFIRFNPQGNPLHGEIGGKELFAVLANASGGGEPSRDLDSIIKVMIDQLGTGNKYDKDIIDGIVRTLGLPWSPNKLLTGSHLQQLQKTLLSPSEMATTRKVRDSEELRCPRCDQSFQSGEAVTVQYDGQGKPHIYCTSCAEPAFISCHGKHKVELTSEKIWPNFIKSTTKKCEGCARDAEKTKRDAEAGQAVNQLTMEEVIQAVNPPRPVGDAANRRYTGNDLAMPATPERVYRFAVDHADRPAQQAQAQLDLDILRRWAGVANGGIVGAQAVAAPVQAGPPPFRMTDWTENPFGDEDPL